MIPKIKTAGILAIGTEITTGQIVDTNSAWIANELTNLHIPVVCKMAVADDDAKIIESLTYLAKQCDLIICTGGLGPTSDDRTRQNVAAWTQAPLTYHVPSWDKIVARFAALGREASESNRQQCYFPAGAQVLLNEQGTADAFAIDYNQVTCIVLPGVPHEVKHVWQHQVHAQLQQRTQGARQQLLFRWHTIGQSESRIAELVDEAIAGSTLLAGYRPHFPYIETKLWSWDNELATNKAAMARVDAVLQPWLVGKDDEDLAQTFIHNCQNAPVLNIYDTASHGALTKRLATAIYQHWLTHSNWRVHIHTSWQASAPTASAHEGLTLLLEPGSAKDTWFVSLITADQRFDKQLTSPYRQRGPFNQDTFMVEATLQWACQCLNGGVTS